MKNQTETLTVGSPAPAFTLPSANREGRFSLSDLLSTETLVIEFLRGTWWPNCRKRLAQLEPHKEEIVELGASLVYVAAENKTGIWKPAKYLSENPVSFPFLLDEDRSVTKAYGLYHAFGHDAFRIAHPATLITDCRATVRYIYRGDNQTDRAPIEEILDAVRNIR